MAAPSADLQKDETEAPPHKRMKQRHRLAFIQDGGKPSVLVIDQQDYYSLEMTLRGWCVDHGCTTIEAIYRHHVMLNRMGRVTSLRHLDFPGRIPTSLFDLDGLRHLEINWTSDSQVPREMFELPREISMLTMLEELKVARNGHLQTLPSELGCLGHLKTLDLDSLDGLESLPKAIGELHSLENLRIGFCSQLTCLPDSIGGLKSLKKLDIEECKLASLPNSIEKLQGLEFLAFSIRFLKTSPTFIRNLSNLTHLNTVNDELDWIESDISFASLCLPMKLTELTLAASHLVWIQPCRSASREKLRAITTFWDLGGYWGEFAPSDFERICKFIPSVEELRIYLIPYGTFDRGYADDVWGIHHRIEDSSSWALANASLSLPTLRELTLEVRWGICDEVLLSTLHLPNLEFLYYTATEDCSIVFLCEKLLKRCPKLINLWLNHLPCRDEIPPDYVEALLSLPIHYLDDWELRTAEDSDQARSICRLGCVMSMNRARSLLGQGQRRLCSALLPLIFERPCKAFGRNGYSKSDSLAGITEDADAIFVLLTGRVPNCFFQVEMFNRLMHSLSSE